MISLLNSWLQSDQPGLLAPPWPRPVTVWCCGGIMLWLDDFYLPHCQGSQGAGLLSHLQSRGGEEYQ